jgi:hypothetical protein
MPMLILNYPHIRSSLEPQRLRKEEIWQVGEAARSQICGAMQRPKVELARIVARAKHFRVNGLSFDAHWELGRPVTDDMGNAVMGAVEYDESWPMATMIYINGDVIGDRDDIARSTAVHELGHAVFDAPSWIQGGHSPPSRREAAAPARHFQQLAPGEEGSKAGIDWPEWRANEFMGAFLTPRGLLHRHMHKRAAALGIPLISMHRDDDLPVVNGRKAGFDAIETLAIELAEIFGVSIPFTQVRLHKYGLVTA